MIYEKEIEGVVFKARYRGFETGNRIQETCTFEDSNIISRQKLAECLFREIFIEPENLDLDYFDRFENSLDVLDEVINFGIDAMFGRTGRALTDRELKVKVKDDWAAWRLVLSDIGNFTHDYVFHHMTPQEIREANIAIDKVYKDMKKRK